MVIQRVPTSATQRIVLAHTDERGRANQHVAVEHRIRGRFDRRVLERTLATLVERHEALRTTLRTSGGQCEQLVWDALEHPSDELDLSSRPTVLAEEAVRFVDTEVDSFDSPLLAVRTFKLDTRDHIVSLRMHHVIADGGSCKVLAAEFASLYSAYLAGKSPSLPPPAAQHRDYCAYEQAAAGDARKRAYWKDRVLARPSRIALGADRLSPVPSVCSACALSPIDASGAADLERFAVGVRASVPIVVLAGVASSLIDWGEDGVRFVVVHANRYRPELQGVVGPLFGFLPVEIDLTGDPTYREVLSRTRRAWAAALANCMPYASICEASGIDMLENAAVGDLQFNFIARPTERRRLTASNGDASAGTTIKAVEAAPLRLRRIRMSGRGEQASWGIDHRQLQNGFQRFVTAQAGVASDTALDALGEEIVGTLPHVIAQPDRPLSDLLAERRGCTGRR